MLKQLAPSRVAVLVILCVAAVHAQDKSAVRSEKSAEVTVEIKRDHAWQAVDPHIVLRANDEIRFQFLSSDPGYLYVFTVSSSGQGSWLYPRPGQGQTNHVEPGTRYVIPSVNGSFLVGGEPGYDVTYWLVSPTPLNLREPDAPRSEPQPNTLRPRCGETVLRARGICMDQRAGAAPVEDLKKVPVPISTGASGLVARELTFHSEQDSTRISATDSRPGLLVYQFLIAHI